MASRSKWTWRTWACFVGGIVVGQAIVYLIIAPLFRGLGWL